MSILRAVALASGGAALGVLNCAAIGSIGARHEALAIEQELARLRGRHRDLKTGATPALLTTRTQTVDRS